MPGDEGVMPGTTEVHTGTERKKYLRAKTYQVVLLSAIPAWCKQEFTGYGPRSRLYLARTYLCDSYHSKLTVKKHSVLLQDFDHA